jgi:hypothetical protein
MPPKEKEINREYTGLSGEIEFTLILGLSAKNALPTSTFVWINRGFNNNLLMYLDREIREITWVDA